MSRPLSVTIIAILLIVTGAAGLATHLSDFHSSEDFLIAFVRALAIVAGSFMLLGHDWARWLALAWILFHVVVGALHSVFQFATHVVICAAFFFILLRRPAAQYFRSPQP